jgi:hypothetical protein
LNFGSTVEGGLDVAEGCGDICSARFQGLKRVCFVARFAAASLADHVP